MERQGILILGMKPDEPHGIIWVSENPEWLVFDSPADCPVRLVGCYPRSELTRQSMDDEFAMDIDTDMPTQDISYWEGPSSEVKWNTTTKATVAGIIAWTSQSSEVALE